MIGKRAYADAISKGIVFRLHADSPHLLLCKGAGLEGQKETYRRSIHHHHLVAEVKLMINLPIALLLCEPEAKIFPYRTYDSQTGATPRTVYRLLTLESILFF